jgi:hypothetical protein
LFHHATEVYQTAGRYSSNLFLKLALPLIGLIKVVIRQLALQ